jgi:solute carrier family 35 (UDP-sugar transporter), member A1/2/3
MALSTSSILLILYISCETVRANYAYYAFHTFPQISASIVTLLSEIFKLFVAAFFLLRTKDGFSIAPIQSYIESAQKGEIDTKRVLRYALPAGLYLANNLIYYTVLPLTTPSLLQVCVLAKLPTTGILHHYMIKRQNNVFAWISLLFLCIGLAVFNIPSKPQSSTEVVAAWYLAPIAGFVIACLSALASISSETSTKEGEFWESQAYLYIWGMIFAVIAYPLAPASGRYNGEVATDSLNFYTSIFALVVITAGTGLVVAVVLRARDNILKVIGTAASLITIAASQFVLLPELRASTFTPWRVCGGGIVTTSTWCYNHYSQQPWTGRGWAFTALPAEDVEEDASRTAINLSASEDEKLKEREEMANDLSLNDLLRPDPTKIMACAIFTAFVTFEVALRTK